MAGVAGAIQVTNGQSADKRSAQIVIVGGGIAGLATAYSVQKEAAQANLAITCTVLEGSSRAGGKILTEQIEGFGGMDRNVGDDHETARRVRSAGLRAVLTPMVYDVNNHLPTLRAYAAQMKRWFVFPRQAMLPMMRPRERAVTLLGSAGTLIPSLLALLALAAPRSAAPRALATALALFNAVYALCERLYLRRSTPLGRWPLVPVVGLLTPAQIVGAIFSGNEVEWRGRRILISSGGDFREVGAG